MTGFTIRPAKPDDAHEIAEIHYAGWRNAYGSVPCDVRFFGDPIYGVTKHCEVRRDAALGGGSGGLGQGGSWGGGDHNWRYCAGEGQVCRVNGRAQVRCWLA